MDMKMRGMIGKWKFIWHSSAVAEIGGRVFRPLVRLREQHAVLEAAVHVRADLLRNCASREVLAVGAVALVQVGHRIEAQPVHPQVAPEVHHRQRRLGTAGLS